MSKVSIIIPVYNTSRHLSQCLKSVIRQDYRNLEIILVNDASTDNSLEICRRFADKDSRIIIIDKQKNEGLELARRSGLDVVSGKYIMHLDSDDWLAHRRVISGMYQKAEETGADYVEIKIFRTLDNLGLIKKQFNPYETLGLIEQPELFDRYFVSFFGRFLLVTTLCGKLYRKSFVDNIDIRPLGLAKGEDAGYNIQLFPFLKKIYILDDYGYCYRYGGMTSRYIPNLMNEAKKLQSVKEIMIEKYDYRKIELCNKKEFIEILKADIRQRIRFHHKEINILKFIEEELSDSYYKPIIDFFNKSNYMNDPFVRAMMKKDFEQMYDICLSIEKKYWWKRKLLMATESILGKIF